MSNLIKKSFQLGKAVYAQVNEIVAEQTNKPQHPSGGFNYTNNNAPPLQYGGAGGGGSYQQTQIPGQYTSQGQGQSVHVLHAPPALPPRPSDGYVLQQHSFGYQSGPAVGSPQTHAQNGGQAYGQGGYGHGQQYGGQGAVTTPGANQSPVHMGQQTTGTISPVSHAGTPQSNWQHAATLPTPPTDKPPLSAWEQAGSTQPPASSPPSASWAPTSPPPTAATPFQTQGAYTPPTPMNAPLQPFPQQYNPHVPSPTGAPQHSAPQSPPAHAPTPPLSPPLPSPPIAQPYNHNQQYAPVSPALPPAAPFNAHPYGAQNMSSPSPPAAYPAYQAPQMQATSPQPQVYTHTPVSPTSGQMSPLPHPPAFVSELPAFSEPKPPQAPNSNRQPPPAQVSSPIPEGYAELPAELPSEPPTARPSASTNVSPKPSPTTIPAAAVTPASAVEQPKPVHPVQQSPPPAAPAAYAPQAYTPAQPSHTPPAAGGAYQPYQPAQSLPAQAQQPLPPPPSDTQGAYKPYTAAPVAQGPTQYTAMPAQGPPPAHSNGVPQRMGSLASKFSGMSVGGSQGGYAPYPGTAGTGNSSPNGYSSPPAPQYH